MRFIHMADMHFDTPFTFINNKNNLGTLRRLNQREVFKNIINYIKENNIPFLFICGDLYEHQYVKEETIDKIESAIQKASPISAMLKDNISLVVDMFLYFLKINPFS